MKPCKCTGRFARSPQRANNVNSTSIERWSITKTYLYNSDPLKPHFYIAKLGFTGVYIIFLISAQKHRLWVLVRTASSNRLGEAVLTSTHDLCFEQTYIKYQNFSSENVHFLMVKFSKYLNRRVFVMNVMTAWKGINLSWPCLVLLWPKRVHILSQKEWFVNDYTVRVVAGSVDPDPRHRVLQPLLWPVSYFATFFVVWNILIIFGTDLDKD